MFVRTLFRGKFNFWLVSSRYMNSRDKVLARHFKYQGMISERERIIKLLEDDNPIFAADKKVRLVNRDALISFIKGEN